MEYSALDRAAEDCIYRRQMGISAKTALRNRIWYPGLRTESANRGRLRLTQYDCTQMDRQRWRFWLYAGAALAAGLLLRLWFVADMGTVAGDSLIYGDIAKNLLEHGVYGLTHRGAPGSLGVIPTLIRLPGYPLFLAACFRVFGMENYRAVMNVQIAADLATCCLAGALAGRLFGRRAALVVLWLAALCPFTANYVAAPLTEPLALTSIALAFYGFARWQDAGGGFNRWLWVTAAALGTSILLRPEQGLLAAAVLPAMLWAALAAREGRGGPLRAALPVLAAALCAVLPLAPWTLRNWRTFHVFQPLAPRSATDPGELQPLGFDHWYRTWGIDFASTYEVYWNYNGARIEFTDVPPRAFNLGSQVDSAELRTQTAALLDDYNVTTISTASIDTRFNALGEERIRAHPLLYYAGLPVARLLNMILRPRTEMMDTPPEWWQWSSHPAETAFAAAYAALNFGYIALGIAGFFAWRRRRWLSTASIPHAYRALAFAMAASLILRCALLLTIDNSEPRYTLEFFPVLLVWAGALFVERPVRHLD